MTLFEAHAMGKPLAVMLAPDHQRLLAAVWPDGGGVGFADVGWLWNDSGHPFHWLEGPVLGDGPSWTVGAFEVREVHSFEPIMSAWDAWREAANAAGDIASTEAAVRAGREALR